MSLVVPGYILLLSPNLSVCIIICFFFCLPYLILVDGTSDKSEDLIPYLFLQENGDPATDDGLHRVVHYPFAVNEKVLIKVGHYFIILPAYAFGSIVMKHASNCRETGEPRKSLLEKKQS